ncbi:hypothetical protein C7120_06610 [Prevotella sp. oral taxon 376]|uniref:hypothetical protein n=1 Tax=Prevotella sp. oral taxon 376 TaxID=712466 RepID=UPI000D1D8481|nr:hypothetical protein [Prevotella sp. oral taxon 376]PTL34209.1 hypothetical protein C7120_06610 [Prevotella sp. oral taxon 376]
MKQLNKTQGILFLVGGMLMVAGAGCFVFMWQQKVVCWVFLLGVILFTLMQLMQTYEGNDLVVKRLKRIQAIADILFILSGFLMVDTAYQYLLPLFKSQDSSGYYAYLNYVYNKWVILLLIAALLELYTTHRINYELNKTKNT